MTEIGKRQREDGSRGDESFLKRKKGPKESDLMSRSCTVYPFNVPDLPGERQRIHSHIHLAGISTHIPPPHTHWYPSTYTQTLQNSSRSHPQSVSNRHTPGITSECFLCFRRRQVFVVVLFCFDQKKKKSCWKILIQCPIKKKKKIPKT